MTSKLKSNSFGSFEKQLTFSVTNAFSEQLKEADWQVVGEWAGGTYFRYSFSGRGRGHDEEALWSLGHALPENLPDGVWRVIWERSRY